MGNIEDQPTREIKPLGEPFSSKEAKKILSSLEKDCPVLDCPFNLPDSRYAHICFRDLDSKTDPHNQCLKLK